MDEGQDTRVEKLTTITHTESELIAIVSTLAVAAVRADRDGDEDQANESRRIMSRLAQEAFGPDR